MRIDLLGGDAQPRSSLAANQRRLNLYTEATDSLENEPGKVTLLPTPGLRVLGTSPNGKPIRGLYRASNGDLYAAAGFDIYYVDPKWKFNHIGAILSTATLNPIKFADNGTSVILCDGTPVNGYSINMSTRNKLSQLYNPGASDELTSSSTGWLGSTYLDYVDGYLIANSLKTPAFYISNAQDTIFDALQFATKNAYPDLLVAAIVQHRVLWLIGTLTTEVWYDSGGGATLGNNFPFEIMPGVAIDYGCIAPYSIAKAETQVFWLSQNLNGTPIVILGAGYAVQRISTHPLEHILSGYKLDDCIAYCYTQEGHSFYCMNFPSADATWCYDLATKEWHQRAWIDQYGNEHRHRSTMHAFAYGTNVVNDWNNANLYALDLQTFNDNGDPIKRLVQFPRQIDNDEDHRLVFRDFVAEVDVGDTKNPNDSPLLALSWSDDKGKTWGNALAMPLGQMGHTQTFVKWNRLGLARNRNFRLEWTANCMMALQAAFVDIEKTGA